VRAELIQSGSGKDLRIGDSLTLARCDSAVAHPGYAHG
jgi:hypothetical protein